MTREPEGEPPAAKRRPGRFTREDIEARTHAFELEFKAQVAVRRAQIDATNVRIEKATGRNLPVAILIGFGLGGGLLASLLFDKEFFMVFAAGLVGFTSFELASVFHFSGRNVPRVPSVIAALVLVPVSFYGGDSLRWLAMLAAIAFVALWQLAEFIGRPRSLRALVTDLAAGALIQVYVTFLGTFAVLLTAKPEGQWWTLTFLVIVVSVDIGAYATGLSVGKHPMAPRISPKKTWEGFAGSVIAALIAGSLLALFLLHRPLWVGLVFGAVMVFTATIGDLTESLIKRDLGIKDISTWLPGHGGFLDRLDSVLPSAAAAYGIYLLLY